jgi:serine/threonine-protein kinase RsbW
MKIRTFPGSYSSLEPLSQFVIAQAVKAGLDDAETYGVQLAVDEAATNIIEHGYGGEDVGEITCQCDILAEGLCVILKDHARPFNPGAISEPTLNAPLEEVRPRGLGLFFMQKMMDEVHFDFAATGENTLTMFKRRKNSNR